MNDNASDQRVTDAQKPYAVTVPRPGTRTKTGGIHKASRRAIIRTAREMRPDLAEMGVREMRYGTQHSVDTVVIFEPEWSVHMGLN